MEKQKGICEECKKEYEYEYNPKYPRKYCFDCSAAKKAKWEDMQGSETIKPEVIKMVEQVKPLERKSVKGSAFEKDPVGLAVEVFCSMNNANADIEPQDGQLMAEAIALVKQVQEAFS